MKTKQILITALFAACISIIITACYKSKTDYNNGMNSYAIKIQNSAFSPASLTVGLNSKVTWTNNDNMVHTIVANDGSFNSGDIAVNSSYSMTFTKAGMVNYHDTRDSNMVGVIVVSGVSPGGGY
jgi:plastocyanin